jgi:glycerophosphoryl diester phosphodiesterase
MTIKGIAHRGYPKKYSENTLSSFQAACDLSFSHVELDVHLSKDEIPVVMHDPRIDRMSNGTGYLKDYTLEQLKRFRIGQDETIPTLEEALCSLKGRATVIVELKQTGDFYTGLEEKVLDVIRKINMVDQIIISSFDHYALIRMRQLCKDIQLSLLLNGCTPFVFPSMEEIHARYLSVNYAYLTNDYVHECTERGFQLIARVIDTIESMKITLKYPSVLYCTNELEQWKIFYQRYHLKHSAE